MCSDFTPVQSRTHPVLQYALREELLQRTDIAKLKRSLVRLSVRERERKKKAESALTSMDGKKRAHRMKARPVEKVELLFPSLLCCERERRRVSCNTAENGSRLGRVYHVSS